MEIMTPKDALADPRFPVLRGPGGDNLRDCPGSGGPDDRPPLPTGWRWTRDEPPKLAIPRRWRVRSANDYEDYDEKPSATELWDWVPPAQATARYGCDVINTWTGEESTEQHTEHPVPPQCLDGADRHKWTSPIEIVGGIEDNPGVHGKGGGVVIHEVCRRCGSHRHTDTWATDGETGEEGLLSLSYEEPDAAGCAYAAASRLVETAALDDKDAVAATVAGIDIPGETTVDAAVAAGVCRTGAERWIRCHGTVTLEQLGRILHRVQRDDRIELARGMARVLMNDARAA